MPIALALALGPACHRTPPRVDTIEDGNLPALSQIEMKDARGEVQLLSGFHQVEQQAWRWTMGKFSVVLQPPAGAAQKGARLELAFTVPDSVISRRGSVTLAAAVESRPLEPQTYAQAGQYTYVRDVPASAFTAGPVKVDFALDKFLAAGELDGRELGLIVKSVALSP